MSAARWARAAGGRRRPAAVLVAAVVGLGSVGAAAGAALGAVGAAGSPDPHGHHAGHHRLDDRPGPRFAR
jgi:hypothetical protein